MRIVRRVDERWATFDCYGTLIDWNGGIRAQLARLWPDEEADALLRCYHEVEPQVEHEEPSSSYREVMRRVLARLGEVPPGEEDALGQSLPHWSAFREVPASLGELRARGWKLAILSNTDGDFIEASMRQIGVPFELAIVASEIRSYKPERRHWLKFFEETDASRDAHVHVAQSHFHDVVPAGELGLRTIWINRYGERHDPPPNRELSDLSRLADTLDELVPA